ncbi:protein EMBRYONIC FLOWER 1 isoform X2 [Punica granatum]|uniref:Protein EMBRYONIC FLOWER 1 isoform X2 n=2 Tax=Punica granatum TaxID=22663 RepID=A0A6P8BU55_PUNGR|nr:protein EMBRYONIC FLOWER 1 isoform X2 [Punica granatum]
MARWGGGPVSCSRANPSDYAYCWIGCDFTFIYLLSILIKLGLFGYIQWRVWFKLGSFLVICSAFIIVPHPLFFKVPPKKKKTLICPFFSLPTLNTFPSGSGFCPSCIHLTTAPPILFPIIIFKMESSSNREGEEGVQCTRSLSGPNLKHDESFIQIDSISIDLPNVNSKNDKTTKCEHFSIRKYVSDMRLKDDKACWPFESNTKSGPTELQSKYPLPPLDVPKFRWWQCQNCLQGICDKENGKSVLVNDLSVECNSDGPSCTDIALTRSETMVLVSDFKQILILDNGADKREADADCLVGVTANEPRALLRSDKREERDGGSDAAVEVPENGLEDNVYSEPCRPNPNAAKVNDVSQGQEQEAEDAGSPKNLQLQGDASHDCDRETKEIRYSQTLSVAVDGVNGGPDSLTVRQNGHTSDELHYPSSDSAEVGPGYRSRDKPGALHRRKVRKVRLLSDLLGQSGNLNMNNIRREESPLPAISDASEESGAKKVCPGRKMKRKFPLDNEYKAVVSNKDANEVEIIMGDAEENRKEVVGDVFAKMDPRSLVKSGWTVHGEEAHSGLLKKKRKKKKNEVEPLQPEVAKAVVSEKENDAYSLMGHVRALKNDLTKHIDDESIRTVTKIKKKKKKKNKLTQESFQEKISETRGKVAVDVSTTSYGQDALTGREMGSPFSSMLKMDGNSCMCKKKSKMPQGEDDHTARISQSSSSKLREDSVTGIKFGLVQSPATIRFLADGDGTVKKGIGFSSYGDKTEAKHGLSLDYGPASTMPWRQVGPEEGQVRKENTVSTHLEPKYASNRPDEFSKRGVHHNHTSKEPTYSMPYINEKQSYTSQFGDMGRFLMPQKEISVASSKGEFTGSREKSTVMKNHSSKTSTKASARGTCSDDIPMEIVELMAKIQYENSLHDTVTDKTQLDTGKSPSYQNLRYGDEYKNGEPNLSHKEGFTRDQIQPKNVKKLRNAEHKAADVNYSPHMNTNDPIMNQVEQNHSKGHGILFSRYTEKASGSKRNENTMANHYKKSSVAVEGLSACNTCHVAGAAEEPFHLWSSSTIPIVRTPAQKNVPHNAIFQSSGLKSPGLKVSSKYEKPNKGFLMENSSAEYSHAYSSAENSHASRPNGVKGQSSLGSSDFYSNEKIPALHLLSLMDGRYGPNIKGNSRLAKQPSSIPCGYPPKELNFGAYRASETLRCPSSDYRTINFLASGKHDNLSSAVPIGSSSSWFESHENLRNGVMGQVPLKVREKGKNKCSDLIGSIGGLGSQKYVPSGCIPVYHQETKELIGASNSVVYRSKCPPVDNSEKEHLRSTTSSVWPPRYSLEMGICTVNRNPAEFSAPEVGNVYTIGGSELRFGKRVRAPEWSAASIIDLERPKRGRKKKIATANHQQAEHPQIL